jgi:hypothetical protein
MFLPVEERSFNIPKRLVRPKTYRYDLKAALHDTSQYCNDGLPLSWTRKDKTLTAATNTF